MTLNLIKDIVETMLLILNITANHQVWLLPTTPNNKEQQLLSYLHFAETFSNQTVSNTLVLEGMITC